MIPNKIYIPQNISQSDVASLFSPDDKGRGIEFIRKDALLEWAKDKLPVESTIYGFMGGYMAAYKQVIDKLNEM